jgi:hypothetical protein
LKSKVSDLAFALRLGGKRKGVRRKMDFAQRRKARKDWQRLLFHLNIICEAQPEFRHFFKTFSFSERASPFF